MAIKGNELTVNYIAWNTSTNIGVPGDDGNHTLKLIKDGVVSAVTGTPAELDATNCPGIYSLTLTATEMNANFITVAGVSSTSNVIIIPIRIATENGLLENATYGLEAIKDAIDDIDAGTTTVLTSTSSYVGWAGEYVGLNRLQLIHQVLRGLGSPVTTPGTDTTADYSRYPKQDIIDKLNEGQLKFVSITKCITSFAIVEAVASQSQYRLPKRCLKVTAGKWYSATTSYEELEILPSMDYLKRISNSWKTDGTGTCEYIYPAYNFGNIKTFGVYPKPASTGTTFTGTSMGVVTSTTDFTFTGNVTGQHKTGFSSSAFLVDSAGRDFTTLGIVVGMMIFNTTDGSSGQITAIGDQDATNDKISVTLAGGTDNDFDTADSFEITVGQNGVVIRADGTEEYIFNAEYGEMQDITPLSGNFMLDYVMRPLSLDSDNQIPEIPQEYHSSLVEYAIWKLGSSEYNGVQMREKAADAKESFMQSLEDHKNFSQTNVKPENFIEDRDSGVRDLYTW